MMSCFINLQGIELKQNNILDISSGSEDLEGKILHILFNHFYSYFIISIAQTRHKRIIKAGINIKNGEKVNQFKANN